MKLTESTDGVILDVHVKPKAKEFKVVVEDDGLVVFSSEAPVKGRVNKELVKELSRLFKRRVEIVSGLTSTSKRILVTNATANEVNEVLRSLS